MLGVESDPSWWAMFRSLETIYAESSTGTPIDSNCVPRELIEELLIRYVVTAHARMCVRDL